MTKLKPDGSALVYSTYLGGSSTDIGYGIAIDSSGHTYVTGSTNSTNFPIANAFQGTLVGGTCTYGCPDAFVTEFNAAGSALLYSTYLGGSARDYGSGIAVDSSGNAYVTGTVGSTDFPTTTGAFQTIHGADGGAEDAFVTKLPFVAAPLKKRKGQLVSD